MLVCVMSKERRKTRNFRLLGGSLLILLYLSVLTQQKIVDRSTETISKCRDRENCALRTGRDETLESNAQDRIAQKDLNRVRVVHARYGFVYVQLINSAYMELVFNWICHVQDEVLDQTFFFATDTKAASSLRAFQGREVHNVILHTYDSTSLTYGQLSYYYFMAFRLELVEQLLKHGISIWLVESDSTWFENPGYVISEYSGFDVITGQDCLLEESCPQAGNIFLNASAPAALQMIQNLKTEQLDVLLELPEGEVGVAGNEMHMLPKHLAKLRWAFFPNKLFVGGLWYMNSTFRAQVSPIMIQNNWIVGNDKKVERAKSWGHWYLDDELGCGGKKLSRKPRRKAQNEGLVSRFFSSIFSWLLD